MMTVVKINKEIYPYLEEVRPEFKRFYLNRQEGFEEERCKTHPSKQKLPGGRLLHTIQVIKKALELNQSCSRVDIIEAALVHDMKGWEELPLNECQVMAIKATKGKIGYKQWRKTKCYKFVVLLLIADMWSAFLNEKDL